MLFIMIRILGAYFAQTFYMEHDFHYITHTNGEQCVNGTSGCVRGAIIFFHFPFKRQVNLFVKYRKSNLYY